MLMGSACSFVNNSELRCNIRVFTVGRSFVVVTSNLLAQEESEHKLHKVWYDIVYDFSDGSRYEDPGRYFGSDQRFELADIYSNLELRTREPSDGSDGQSIKSATSPVPSQTSPNPDQTEEKVGQHAATLDAGTPLHDEAASADFATTPVALFQAMYKDDKFMRSYWDAHAHLRQIDIGEWQDLEGKDGVEKRSMTYIMPLDGSLGPKETHCNSTEIVQHLEEDEYIAVLGECRTPDVPFGSSFYTQTRTCFTWNKRGGVRMNVTCETKFDKSVMLKGIIKHSAHEGQVKSNQAMIKHLRQWIKDHPDDFPTPKVMDPQLKEETKTGESPVVETSKHEVSDYNGPLEQPVIRLGPLELTTKMNQISPLTVLVLGFNIYLLFWTFLERCPCPR